MNVDVVRRELGAEPTPDGTLRIELGAIGLRSLFGGGLTGQGRLALQMYGVVFSSPPELAACGPIALEGSTREQIRRAIMRAQDVLSEQVEDDQTLLRRLGFRNIKLISPDPRPRASHPLSTGTATLVISAIGELVIETVGSDMVNLVVSGQPTVLTQSQAQSMVQQAVDAKRSFDALPLAEQEEQRRRRFAPLTASIEGEPTYRVSPATQTAPARNHDVPTRQHPMQAQVRVNTANHRLGLSSDEEGPTLRKSIDTAARSIDNQAPMSPPDEFDDGDFDGIGDFDGGTMPMPIVVVRPATLPKLVHGPAVSDASGFEGEVSTKAMAGTPTVESGSFDDGVNEAKTRAMMLDGDMRELLRRAAEVPPASTAQAASDLAAMEADDREDFEDDEPVDSTQLSVVPSVRDASQWPAANNVQPSLLSGEASFAAATLQHVVEDPPADAKADVRADASADVLAWREQAADADRRADLLEAQAAEARAQADDLRARADAAEAADVPMLSADGSAEASSMRERITIGSSRPATPTIGSAINSGRVAAPDPEASMSVLRRALALDIASERGSTEVGEAPSELDELQSPSDDADVFGTSPSLPDRTSTRPEMPTVGRPLIDSVSDEQSLLPHMSSMPSVSFADPDDEPAPTIVRDGPVESSVVMVVEHEPARARLMHEVTGRYAVCRGVGSLAAAIDLPPVQAWVLVRPTESAQVLAALRQFRNRPIVLAVTDDDAFAPCDVIDHRVALTSRKPADVAQSICVALERLGVRQVHKP